MKIIRADKAGFCFGVERAVSMAQEALTVSRGPVCSLGPIIHNPQVVAELESAGLRVVDSLNQIASGTVIIRSHGALASIYAEADRRGLKVVDATCPFVKNMHQLARALAKEGYQIVLFGDVEHPEIGSLLGDPDFRPLVVGSPQEVGQVKAGKKVALLSQTTQSPEMFSAVADALLPKVKELRIYNTICNSTRQRQEESLQIAREVDVMIVIGGRNSANTHRLFDLCRGTGTPTYHVEIPEELSPEWIGTVDKVGVTAGASTPRRLIDSLVDRIKNIEQDLET